MIPVLAAIGISMLSRLAGTAVTALIDGGLGGGATIGSGNGSFDAILERSQATTSTPALARGSDTLSASRPVMTGVGGVAGGASVGLLTSQIASQRTTAPLTALLSAPRMPMNPRSVEALIGRKIAANGSLIDLRRPSIQTLQYRLPTAAASVQVEVRDLQGTVVRTVQLGSQPGGLHQLPFDGRGLSPGLYQYRIVAADTAGLTIAGASTAYGRVTGVQLENGQPFLAVGRALVPLSGVFDVSVDQPSAFVV